MEELGVGVRVGKGCLLTADVVIRGTKKKKEERSGFVLFQVWIHFLRGIRVAMSRIKNKKTE